MGLKTKRQEIRATNAMSSVDAVVNSEYDVIIVLKNSGFEINAIVSEKTREELIYQFGNRDEIHFVDKRSKTQVHIAGNEIAAIIENPRENVA